MAKRTKITDKRLKNPDQYRLRYRIYFPDGGRRDRSRRYRTNSVARAKLEIATVLENRTRQILQSAEDILVWRNEDLITLEDSKLLVIDPMTFETMINSNAEVAFRMIKKLADRLRETDRKIELLMIKDSSSRVIHILERLIEDIGVKKNDSICLPITINELAPKSGVKMDHVNDVIDKLKKAKIISFSSDEIYVHDTSKLKQFLEFLILKEQFGDLD